MVNEGISYALIHLMWDLIHDEPAFGLMYV
jgi:hypothetical protein